MSTLTNTASDRIDHTVVMVTADIATRWLSRNESNRKVRQSRVEKYRRDMKEGRWGFAGDPIRFSISGRLLDGQHRLYAIAGTDLTIPMLVLRGLPEESQTFMDQGGVRTAGDQLSMRGHKEANAIAAGVRFYLTWLDGNLFGDRSRSREHVTNPRIEEWVNRNPALADGLSNIIHVTKKNDAPPRVASGAWIIFAQISPTHADEFFTRLAQGGEAVDHPITVLDKRLQRHRREGLKMSDRDYLALIIQAWNSWREGRTLSKFQRPRGGVWSPDNFPTPR